MIRWRQARASVAATTVVPLPPLTDQQTVTGTGDLPEERPAAGRWTRGMSGATDRSGRRGGCQPDAELSAPIGRIRSIAADQDAVGRRSALVAQRSAAA